MQPLVVDTLIKVSEMSLWSVVKKSRASHSSSVLSKNKMESFEAGGAWIPKRLVFTVVLLIEPLHHRAIFWEENYFKWCFLLFLADPEEGEQRKSDAVSVAQQQRQLSLGLRHCSLGDPTDSQQVNGMSKWWREAPVCSPTYVLDAVLKVRKAVCLTALEWRLLSLKRWSSNALGVICVCQPSSFSPLAVAGIAVLLRSNPHFFTPAPFFSSTVPSICRRHPAVISICDSDVHLKWKCSQTLHPFRVHFRSSSWNISEVSWG